MTFLFKQVFFKVCLAFALMILPEELGNEVFTPLRDIQ